MKHTKFYTQMKVAEMFGVNHVTIKRWAKVGKIPNLKLPSGRFRFPKDEIDELLQRRWEPTEILIPGKMAKRLEKAIKRKFGEDVSLEKGIEEVLEQWVKERKGK